MRRCLLESQVSPMGMGSATALHQLDSATVYDCYSSGRLSWLDGTESREVTARNKRACSRGCLSDLPSSLTSVFSAITATRNTESAKVSFMVYPVWKRYVFVSLVNVSVESWCSRSRYCAD
jgi:hypothetical protein